MVGVVNNRNARVPAASELSIAGFAAAISTSRRVNWAILLTFSLVAFVQVFARVVTGAAVFGADVEVRAFLAAKGLLGGALALAGHTQEWVFASGTTGSTVLFAGL